MRTLKKTLCLVLVLAMMVGLCAMGANAISFDDYADKDAIMHKEAVALLSALEVLQGDANGFRGTDGLTRAEGAKIIAALLAANTTGLKSSFTDMDQAAWADGYVAYCEGIGIIAGYGDGTFGPSDKLTYAQFAKMLLVALGYSAEREEIYGGGWEIAVAKLVNQVGLSSGIADFKYSDPITRDDAAQMAFTALKTTMVGYNGNGLSVANGQLANSREALKNATYDYRADGYTEDGVHYVANDGLMQMIENYFPNFKLKVQADDYGLRTDYWFKGTSRTDKTYTDAKKVATAAAQIVLKTYTTDVALVSADTLYKDGNFTSSNVKALKVYENGKLTATTKMPEKGLTFPLSMALAEYAGATVMLVDTDYDFVADELLVKYALLAQVKSIIAAADSTTKERQVELTIFGNDAGTTVKATGSFDSESFSKKEYVLLYPDTYVAAADAQIKAGTFTAPAIEITTVDSTIGTLDKVGTRSSATTSLTVDGVAYSVGAATFAGMGPDGKAVGTTSTEKYGLNKEITLYTSNGYVLGVNTTATPLADYVFVLSAGAPTTDLVTDDPSWQVAYVTQDGTTATTTVTKNPITGTSACVGSWCIMTPQGDTASFTTAAKAGVTQSNGTAHGLKADTPSVAGVATNANTNFIVRSGAAGRVTVKAYAGIGSVPTFANTVTGAAYALMDDTKAAAIFIDFYGKTAEDEATAAVYFTSKNSDGVVQVGATTYYTYTAINAKGEKLILNLTSDAKYEISKDTGVRGLWTTKVDANGYVTSVAKASAAKYLVGTGVLTSAAYKIEADGGVITVPNQFSYSVADDAAIWIWNGAAVKEGTLEDLDGAFGHIALVTASNESKKATVVYFYPKAIAE